MKQKGFTLIELLVVVAIIGILAAVGTVAYQGYISGARKAIVKSNHKTAVKFIQSEIVKAFTNGEVSQWNAIEKKCEIVNANSVWHTHGQWAFMCLTENTSNNKNPFDNSDVAYKADFSVPEIVGRTHCNWSDTSSTFMCYSRWGSGANEYETSRIQSP